MRDSSEHARLNEAKWNRRAETFDQRRFDFFRFFQWRVISLLDLTQVATFLDIGCGTGWAVRRVAYLLGTEGRAHGIDISPGMIERARAASTGIGNVAFHVANSEKLPFEDGAFDCIICTLSFHHYFHPSRVLDEVSRVLKPRGRVHIMELTADTLFMKLVDARSRRKEPEHVKFYSSREFKTLLESAGMRYVGFQRVWFPLKVHSAEKMP